MGDLSDDFGRSHSFGVTAPINVNSLPKSVGAGKTPRAVSIVGLVNAARALANGTLRGSIYWVDNNAAAGSRFLGTDHLISVIEAGAVVTWTIEPMEVETYVEILDMKGPAVHLTGATEQSLYDGAFKYWKGQVASSAKGEYAYSFSLNVGGREMVLPANLTLDVTG